jgi:hypothetical protein
VQHDHGGGRAFERLTVHQDGLTPVWIAIVHSVPLYFREVDALGGMIPHIMRRVFWLIVVFGLTVVIVLAASCVEQGAAPAPGPTLERATSVGVPTPGETTPVPDAGPAATDVPTAAAGEAATPPGAGVTLPIFDTHAHYSQSAWGQFPPEDIIGKLIRANVARALVSSSPDEGTRKLYELDPARIVPSLRPYRGQIGPGNWYDDETALGYMEERLQTPIYVSIGEIHVHVESVDSPIVMGAARMAVQKGLFLHVHSDADSVRRIFAYEPNARILWAHAGLVESPETVSQMLDEHENLWTDISIRERSIAPNGALDPAWRALFMRHPDRITIGTDTYVPSRWEAYEQIIEFDRGWLAQLPREVAEQIAYRNAVRLFGPGPNESLR